MRVKSEARADASRKGLVIEVLTASVGMVLFALVSHQGLPWAVLGAGGLLLTAATIGRQLHRVPRPAALLGLERPRPKAIPFSALGILIGAGLGLLHRRGMGMAPWSAGGTGAFVPVACLIGVTEELVYRGWTQGAARSLGWPAAVTIAAVAHAAYKTALFAWPPGPMTFDYMAIGLWTAAGGIVIGLLRQFSGSVVPSMLAHAAFDFVVYRAVAHAPWWVWT